MKIIQINCVYGRGSTGKIIKDIHEQFQNIGHDSVVFYGRGNGVVNNPPNVYKFCSEILANFHTLIIRSGLILNYGGNLISTKKLISHIENENPDIVHVHCINGSCVNIYRLFDFLAKQNIKTIITHHACFFFTGSCEHFYDCYQYSYESGCKNCPMIFEATRSKTWDNSKRAWNKMKISISKFKFQNLIFTAVSPWLKSESLKSPIVNNYRCEVVYNGVNTSIFNYKEEPNIIKKQIKYNEEKIALFVGAHFNSENKNDNKGGWYIVELAKKRPDILFVIVALKTEIKNIIPKNIYIWGYAKGDQELAKLYRSSDVTIIASRRETFSMVVAESLCCGTPVLGFNAGGPESIAIKEYSSFVDYGDIKALLSELSTLINNQYSKSRISKKAHEIYSKEEMVRNYLSVYSKLNNGDS